MLHPTANTTPRTAFVDGARDVSPLLLGIIPFGLIVGVTAVNSSIGGVLGYATSLIIFAGAAQLATIQLLEAGSAALVVVVTALVINSRHLMYSAAMATPFREFPRPWRFALPYLLTDQAFLMSITRWESKSDPRYRRWYFVGAGLGLWVPWQLSTLTGVLVGSGIPTSWSLDFAIPLVFLALLIPVLRDRPGMVAAVVGGVTALVAADLPWNLGLIVGAFSGIGAGVVAARSES